MKKYIIFLVALSPLVAACVPSSSHVGSSPSQVAPGQIRIGMTQAEVEKLLGYPRDVYRYKGGAATTGVEELHHYVGGTSVGYIKGKVATFDLR